MKPQPLIWDTYAETIVVRSDPASVLAGPNALNDWPFPEPCHVITAWNPDSLLTSEDENTEANARLAATIIRHGGTVERVVGRSSDSTWSEDSFLVVGVSREQAVEIGRSFGQLAIFELDRHSVHVVRCDAGTVERTRPRIQATATAEQ